MVKSGPEKSCNNVLKLETNRDNSKTYFCTCRR